MKKLLSLFFMVVLLCSGSHVLAATTTYNCTPMADTRLDQRDPGINFGTGTTLKIVGDSDGTEVCRAIIRLNIPPFISVGQIQSANLKLYGGSSGAASIDINIHPITPPALWFEKNLFDPDLLPPNDQYVWGATWNDYGGDAIGQAWTTAGGDYDSGTSTSATIVAGWNNIPITTFLSNNLDTIRKFGMLLKLQDETLNVFKTINSRDNASNKPYLELNVDLGLPATTYMCPTSSDVYIDESLDEGLNNLNLNWKTRVGVSWHNTHGKSRGLWKFEIPAGILDTDIKCARLFLSGSEHALSTKQFVIDCYALDAPFNEETVTWDTLAGGGYDIGVVSSGTIYQELIPPPPDPTVNWRAEIDLTTLLAGNLDKVRDNGMIIKKQDEAVKAHQNIASRECYDDSDVAAYLLIDLADSDSDTVGDACDNCPTVANPGQEDTSPPQGNGIGDACDCEANFDCDQDVDATDVTSFLGDFGRSIYIRPCTNEDPCKGDFYCDGDVDANDVTKFLEDFGRSQYINPCPLCTQGAAWCAY